MRATPFLLAVALLAGGLGVLPAAEASTTTRLAVFGDTDVNDVARKNVNAAAAEGAQGYVGLGDYNYEAPASAWKDMMRPLTSKGAWMALGNHDDRHALGEFFPDGSRWSKPVHGARIVALNGMEPVDVQRLRSDLCGAPESVRIVIAHHNWWLAKGARHPGTEFKADPAAIDKALRECGADLVLAGHEHNYQRMMRDGIPYVIVGTGGRGLYPLNGLPSGTVASCECYGRLLLDLGPDGFRAEFRRLDGAVMDTFSMGRAEPAPAPAPSGDVAFEPRGGNEWWVQARVTGPVASVEARDTDGAWTPLAKKSWGDWAASFRVEPGHDVQYRARTTDGRTVESCWHAHPAGGCRTTTPPSAPAPEPAPGSPTFEPRNGNEWWVQVKVTGEPVAVHAMDTGGPWIALAKKSWGDWAASFRVEPGHDVRYRATLADGSVHESCAFDHPAPTCDGESAPPAPPPEGFEASFTNVRGNTWWVETDVTATGAPLSRVEARIDGGAWHTLDPKSWGSYAKSLRAPTGSEVEFRATATDGRSVTSPAHRWPPA